MTRFVLEPTAEMKAEGQRLADRLRRLRRPLPELTEPLAEVVRAGFQQNFEQEREGGGRAWNPLAPSTVRERIRLGFPGKHPILVRTGRYKRSFLEAGRDHIARRKRTATGWEMEEGSRDYRAAWLEEGTRNILDSDWFHIPPRPVTKLGPEVEGRLTETFEAYLQRHLLQPWERWG